MISRWEDVYALFGNRTIFKQQFDGIEPVGEYLCLVAYFDQKIKGYLPPSELGVEEPTEQFLNLLLGYPVPVVVCKVIRDNDAVILSRRIAVNRLENKFWKSIEIGQEYEGYVLNTLSPGKGLFVDLGGAIADVPPDEVTWLKWVGITQLRNQLPQFGKTKVKITGYDKETKKVSASVKALQENPWISVIPGRYAPGTVHCGITTGNNHTGVFVQFRDGITCLCDLKTFKAARIPPEAGRQVIVRIRSLDLERKRVNGKVVNASPEEIIRVR